MRSVLVTGGTGTFGRALVRHLLEVNSGCRIRVLSRGEHAQAAMAAELADIDPERRLGFFIGDVRDRDRLRRAFDGVEVVVHAAALKRIEVGQYNPAEMVKTNVIGAMNVIEAAQDAGVERVIFLSSDKAYQPISPYGQSKALAESLFLNANNTVGALGTRFSVVRYGNIFNASGSVVPRWRAAIKAGVKKVRITDPECTRFFMLAEDAVQLVIDASEWMVGGETVIPDLPAYRLGDLATAMGVSTEIVGLPSWEKKDESMDEKRCSRWAPRLSVEDLRGYLQNVERQAA